MKANPLGRAGRTEVRAEELRVRKLLLQRVQNRALRIATGSHSNATISHLHHESKLMKVKDHLLMLSSQLLVKCHRISHPSNSLVNEPPGARRMKFTLSTKHHDDIQQFLTNGVIELDNFKPALDALHTSFVRESIINLGPNPLLDTVPPPIAASEAQLSRIQRSTLSQLRSGQCHLLNDYKVLTGRGTSAVCPECCLRRHTVPHLFQCDAVPTHLNLVDLWNNPRSVVEYLVKLPSFATLLPDDPPLPPPPPEPPP